MASIIEFRIPTDQFALAHAATTVSTLQVITEQFVAQNTDSVMPFMRVTTDDFDTFEIAVVEDPSVESFSNLAKSDGERVYHIHWSNNIKHILRLLLEKDGVITTANMSTSTGFWEVQLMTPERDVFSEIYKLCEENGLSLTIDAIYELSDDESSQYGLTDSQYTTLVKAGEMGYYEVPRTTSLSELADELNVSHQALSERLRRAHGNLIDRTLNSRSSNQSENSRLSEK